MTAPPPKISLLAAPSLLGTLRLPAGRDRQFKVGLACAALIHLLIIVGMLVDTGQGRRMGEPDADPDGVSVLIVDAADLKSRTTVPSEMPATPPPQPQAQPQPQRPPTPPQPEPQEQQEQPQKPQVAAPPLPQQPPALDPDAPGEAQPQPQQPPQPQPKQQPRQKQAAARPSNPAPAAPPVLNLNINPAPSFHNRGGSFAPTRPPGITRSGENDEFGRGVIRALQRTVPQLVNTVGRVTVRILINNKGNLGSVEVIRPSGVSNIDQSVVFAVKQSSFPFPPDNSTEVDRTFFVTYIFSLY